MKNKSLFMALSVIAVIAIFTACSTTSNNEARLLSFKIGNVNATSIPAAITNADWADEDMAQAFDTTKTSTMIFDTSDDLANKQVSWKVSSGASAKYGTINTTVSSPDSYSNDSSASFSSGSYVVIKVTAADGSAINYYRFFLTTKSTAVFISGVTISGQTATWGTPSDSFTTITDPGKVNLNSAQGANAEIIVTKGNDGETIRYGKTGNGIIFPTYSTNNVLTGLLDNDNVCLEVTAENGINKTYYKINVELGRSASLTSLKIGDSPETWFLGIPSADWTAVLPPRTEPYQATDSTRQTLPFITCTEPTDGFTIIATSDAFASAQYAKVTSLTDPMPASFSSGSIVINNGEILAIKTTSENGKNFMYYKIPLLVPGAAITKQPVKGPYLYHVGDTAQTMSVTVEGTYDSIQWVYFTSYGAQTTPVTGSNQGTVISGATGLTYTPDTSQAYSQSNARYIAARISRSGYANVFSDRVVVNVVPVGQTLDYNVDLSGIDTTLGPYTKTYENQTFDLPDSAYPPDFDIMNYSKFTAAVKLYSAHHELIRTDNDKANFALQHGAILLKACYNFGMTDTTNNSLANSNEGNNDGLGVKYTPTTIRMGTAGIATTSDHYPVYIELEELRFTGPARQ